MTPTQKTGKAILRQKLRESLKRISSSDSKRRSLRILQKLMRIRAFKKAQKILTYVALPREVQTKPLIQKWLRSSKTLYVPYVHLATKKIEIYKIDCYSDLKRGAYGILEPNRQKNKKGRISELDLMIVPGLGFDRKGGRLGRGGGYFDRFLEKATHTKKIGLAFREQIVKKIPMHSHDVRMDQVIVG